MKYLILIPLLLCACGKPNDTLPVVTITCTQTFGPCATPTNGMANCMNDGTTVYLTYTFTSGGTQDATCTVSQGACSPTSPRTSYITSDSKGYTDIFAFDPGSCK